MTREALESGDARRADVLSFAAATACGEGALPLVREVLDLMVAENVGPDMWANGAFHASLLLGTHPGPAWKEQVEAYLDGGTVEDHARGHGHDDLFRIVEADPGFLHRRDLARACRLRGLDEGGSKPELLDRLVAVAGGAEPGLPPRGVALESLPTAQLRQMCMDYRVEPRGPRDELVARLRELEGEPGADRGYPRDELDGMDVAELREVCRGMGLDTAGKRRALVARIQMAQDEE
jgi:hypothetical protein